MEDQKKTRQQLIAELADLRQKLADCQKAEVEYGQIELEWKELLRAEQEHRLRTEVLAEVTLALTAQTDQNAVLNEILRQTGRLVPYKTAHIMLLQYNTLRVAHWYGYDQHGSEAFIANLVQPLSRLPIDAEVISTRTPRIVADTRLEPHWVKYPETLWVRATLMLPICLRDKVLGILRLDSDTPGQFTKTDVSRLLPLANAAAIALENSRLYEQTQAELAERKQLEILLRSSRARYRAIVEDQTELICRFQPNKIIVFVNDAYCKHFGKERAELIGGSYNILLTDPAEDPMLALQGAFSPNNPVVTTEARWTAPDGEIYWIQWTIRAIFNDRNEIVEYQGVGLDVTRRKQTEEALRKSEQQFRAVVETAHDGIISIDDDNIILSWNNGAQTIFGYTPEEIIGSPLSTIIPERHRKVHQRQFNRAVTNDLAGLIAKTISITGLKKDGSECPIELSMSSWVSGDKRLFTGIVRDVTERVRAEEEIRRHNQELEQLTQVQKRLIIAIEQTAESVVITDTRGIILYVNPAFERTSGYQRDEIVNQTTPRVMKSGKHPPSFYKNLWNTISAGKVWRGHLINRKKDGTLFTEEATISPVRGQNGDIVNYVAVKRDVTSEIQLEARQRQTQIIEGIGRLAGGIAHDFNNMLTVINGRCELLLYQNPDQLSPEIKPEIVQIKKAGEQATTLIRQLLAFGRRQALNPQLLNLNDLIRKIQPALHTQAKPHIQVICRLSPQLNPVWADSKQLELAITCLLNNAHEAMPQGGVITIETTNTYLNKTYVEKHIDISPGAYVMLSITDTGTGMDARTQAKIFEPFFTTKESSQKAGLGLATAHGIIRQSNGHIWVESILNQGTTFKVILPEMKEPAEQIAPPARPIVSVANKTILLVEDDPAVRDVACQFLFNQGYQVLEAECATQGAEIFNHNPEAIALLVTDIDLPDGSGPELAHRLAQSAPLLSVLYISGHLDGPLVQNGKLPASACFLEKPFSSADLISKVQEALTHPPADA